MPGNEGKGGEQESAVADLGRYAGLGLQLALSVGLFLAVGWWLDGRLGTVPLFTILGAFLGGAAGFYSLYQHVVAASRPGAGRKGEQDP